MIKHCQLLSLYERVYLVVKAGNVEEGYIEEKKCFVISVRKTFFVCSRVCFEEPRNP